MILTENHIDLLKKMSNNSLLNVESGKGFRLEHGNRTLAIELESAGYVKALRYRRKGFYFLTNLGREEVEPYQEMA